jgi:hypothetical protein
MHVPVIDRSVFERLFGVRRRRANQLMSYFDGYQAGRTFLLDRLALLEKLAPLEASTEFALEQRRRQRLVESLEKIRRARAGARVTIAVAPVNHGALPDGVQLGPGSMHITFTDVQDLLTKLYATSQAAAMDFESFRAAAEGAPQSAAAPNRPATRAG